MEGRFEYQSLVETNRAQLYFTSCLGKNFVENALHDILMGENPFATVRICASFQVHTAIART